MRQERITVGDQFAYLIVVKQRGSIWIIDGSLYILTLHLLAYLLGKLCIDRVSGACGKYLALERTADESHIAYHVEQFVARRLVVPNQGHIVDETELFDILVRHVHQVSQTVKLALLHRTVIYDYRIVQVATLDKIGRQQRLHLTDKHERAA